MQPLGGHDMGLQAVEQRHQHGRTGTDLVGQRGQAERHALAGIALGLSIERLMLAELLEQDHRQQVRSAPTSRRHMERRGWLADALAVTAGELLPHVLDDFPGARHDLQGLGDILAQLGQTSAAATGACRRARDDDALTRQVLGKWASGRAGAGEPSNGGRLGCCSLGRQLVLRGGRLELLELQLHLVQQAGGALGARAEAVTVELLDLQLEMGD